MTTIRQNLDHEYIETGNPLKRKVKIKGMGGLDNAAIERAEEALEGLSVHFDEWLENEVKALVQARDNTREHGLTSAHFDELFRIAHDVKGEGDTLGYPLATVIGASLCKLLDAPENKKIIPHEIIDNHVDALRLISRDRIKDSDHPVAKAVADRLVEVVLEFAEEQEARKREH